MKSMRLVPWMLLLAPALIAQHDAGRAEAASAEAAAQYEALQRKVADTVAKWRRDELAKAERARAAAEAAKAEGKQVFAMPAMSMVPPYAEFVGEFQAAAERYSGRAGAVPFLLWIATYGSGDPTAVKQAIATLVANHIDSPELAALPPVVGRTRALDRDESAKIFETLIAESPDDNVRAAAMFARSAPIVAKAKIGSDSYLAAKAELEKAAELSGDAAFAGRVRGVIAGREELAKGSIAPDIAGVDLDGVEFKLSDYAGKVVMLDFWGDW